VRGQKIDRGVRKWQKGACENCGAMSHKTKDCCERPRAKPARMTNEVAPDEVIQQDVNFDFDGKRDRWNGYDPAAYSRVIERFEKVEQERKKKKAEEVEEQLRTGKKKEKDRKDKKKTFHTGDSESDTDSDLDESSDDEDKKDDGAVIQKFDHKSRTTVRIREDRAKYLYNLNVHSAHYDPKTRSMRENPHPDKDPSEVPYAGDNWVRKSGEAREVAQLQSFVFEANDRGNEDVHMEANPSAAQMMFEEHRKRKEALKENRKQSILSKYGGQEHLNVLPQELLLAQSEAYVEYSEDGKIIKGQEKAIPQSKYSEDQLENKHTEIWGSFYKDGKWGYACCHQLTRNAYCTGQAGKEAMVEMSSNLGARVPFAERRQLEAPSSSSSASSASSVAQPPAEVNEDTSGDEEEKDEAKRSPVGGKGKRRRSKRSGNDSDSSSESDSREESSSSDSDRDSHGDSSSDSDRRKKKSRKSKQSKRSRQNKDKKKDSSIPMTDAERKQALESAMKQEAALGGKRGYRSNDNVRIPTDKDMEDYMASKVHHDDPMAKFLGQE